MVSVIIPNYNGLPFLKKCLSSLFASLKKSKLSFDVIVVDNGSRDGSVEMIEKLIKDGPFQKARPLKLIKNKKNLGFAKAINQGIRKAKGDYLFLLNNDVILERDYLQKLVAFLEENHDFWAAQGVILNEDGQKVDNAGGSILWEGKVKLLPKPRRLIVSSQEKPLLLSATATLYRKSLFNKIGFFDEDFHSYLEDVDFSLRSWRRRLKLAILPDAVCYHHGRATSQKMGNFKARMDAKNWIFVIIKNWPKDKLIKYCLQIFMERLRNLSGLIKQTVCWKIPKDLFLVYLEILIKLPKMILKRSIGLPTPGVGWVDTYGIL